MAGLAKKQLRKKIPELELALEGKVEEHHRFLLSVQLHGLQAVEEDLGLLEQHIQEKLKPSAAELTLLDEIPGVDGTLAAGIIAEMGGGDECLQKRFSAGILGRDLSWQ
jgi:transposase